MVSEYPQGHVDQHPVGTCERAGGHATSLFGMKMRLSGLGSGDGRDVLLVCPDAQQTEAVGQTIALARIWSRDYRVHVLLLSSEGPLLTALRAHAGAVWLPDQKTHPAAFTVKALEAIMAEVSLLFAVTVSVSSRTALVTLQRAGVPSLALVLEFASRCTPVYAVVEAITYADQVAVPSHLVLTDAMTHDYLLSAGQNVHVVPPGDCDFTLGHAFDEHDAARLHNLLRPENAGRRRFIVLGAGPLTYTNGADIFIELARHVLAQREGRDALFVWACPKDDDSDDSYRADFWVRLRSAGLENRMVILSGAPAASTLYQIADLFVITARADPVSSYGISALRSGLPVVCFDGPVSLSEYLKAAGMSRSCIASYLDMHEMAERVLALAAAPARRAVLSAQSISIASRWFDPQIQADTILKLATAPSRDVEADVMAICASATFDAEFCLGPESDGGDREMAARAYLKSMRTGIAIRKPEPGFHPLIFAQFQQSSTNRDPYVEFLRLGRPQGPWSLPVITCDSDAVVQPVSASSIKAALHIHAYFTDQIPDILARLQRNTARPDLYVSVADKTGYLLAEEILSAYGGKVAAIEIVPNIGRDIGPFLTAFGPRIMAGYDVVGHVHTKKSSHVENIDTIRRWVELTLSGVLGGATSGPLMDAILSHFAMDPDVGVIHPDDPYVCSWTANRAPAQRLLDEMKRGPMPEAFNFPLGTMFWIRTAALKPFIDLDLKWDDYPVEPLSLDGTSLHALERLFGVVPRLDGWRAAVTFTKGISR